MNIKYCNKECEKGKNKSKQLLDDNNSAYDAAISFCFFVEKCFDTCPHKEYHKDSHSKIVNK